MAEAWLEPWLVWLKYMDTFHTILAHMKAQQ